MRGKYEQLKQQRVAEVVDRVASKVSAEEEVRQSRGGGAAAAAASVALDDLRRTQHALLREREARLKVETEAQALRAKRPENTVAVDAASSMIWRRSRWSPIAPPMSEPQMSGINWAKEMRPTWSEEWVVA